MAITTGFTTVPSTITKVLNDGQTSVGLLDQTYSFLDGTQTQTSRGPDIGFVDVTLEQSTMLDISTQGDGQLSTRTNIIPIFTRVPVSLVRATVAAITVLHTPTPFQTVLVVDVTATERGQVRTLFNTITPTPSSSNTVVPMTMSNGGSITDTGSLVGLISGALAAVMFIGLALFFLCLSRRKRRIQRSLNGPGPKADPESSTPKEVPPGVIDLLEGVSDTDDPFADPAAQSLEHPNVRILPEKRRRWVESETVSLPNTHNSSINTHRSDLETSLSPALGSNSHAPTVAAMSPSEVEELRTEVTWLRTTMQELLMNRNSQSDAQSIHSDTSSVPPSYASAGRASMS